MASEFKNEEFVLHTGIGKIVRKDYEAGKHQGLIGCEYVDEESGDIVFNWVDPRELSHYYS